MPLTLAVAGMVGAGKSTLTRALAARFGLQLALESVEDVPAGDLAGNAALVAVTPACAPADTPAADPLATSPAVPRDAGSVLDLVAPLGDVRSRRAGAPASGTAAEPNPWLPLFYDQGAESAKRRYGLPLQLHFLATRFAAMREMRARGGSWILDRTWYEDAEIFARGLFEDGYMTALEHDLYTRLYCELLYSPAARPPRLLIYLHAPLDVILERIGRRGRDKERDTPVAYWERLHARYDRWIERFHHSPVLSLDVRDYDLLRDPGAVEDIAALVRQRIERQLPQTELWPARVRTPVG